MAVSDGDFLFVKYLISNGADIICKDSIGNTPLHFAASSDYKYCSISYFQWCR